MTLRIECFPWVCLLNKVLVSGKVTRSIIHSYYELWYWICQAVFINKFKSISTIMYSLFCESLNKVQMKLTSITPTLMWHLVCLILDWSFYDFVNKWQIIAAVGLTVKTSTVRILEWIQSFLQGGLIFLLLVYFSLPERNKVSPTQ